MIPSPEKKILDVTCGSRTIWFDKHHPAALYCDTRQEYETRIWKSRDGTAERVCTVNPHLLNVGDSSWLAKKYGKLDQNWPAMLHDGFVECMRVLKTDGVLIFKWAESDIPAEKVWKAIGEKPLFGHHSGKRSKTFWACFMKFGEVKKGGAINE